MNERSERPPFMKFTPGDCDSREDSQRPDRFPLSVDQERLWFLEQLTGVSAAYNVSWAVIVNGGFQEPLFERALAIVVQRHPVLRTTFAAAEPLFNQIRIRASGKVRPDRDSLGPVQVLRPTLEPEILREDLSHLAEKRRTNEISSVINQWASRPFDLEKGPLLRVGIIRRSEQRHALLVCMHHLITDWVSFALFRRELSDCYLHLLDSRIPASEQAVGNYHDFVFSQRRMLESSHAAKQKSYWKLLLKGHTATIRLPSDRSRPPLRNMAGSRVYFEVPSRLVKGLRSFAASHAATEFMAYTALLGALLHLYSGEFDVIIGTPVSSRRRPELRRMLGFLLNMLPIRLDFCSDPTLEQVLAIAKTAVLDALDNSEIPYGTIVDTLELDRDTSRNPVFQVCLIYLEADPDEGWFAGMQTEPLEVNNTGARFDLTLAIKNNGDITRGYLEYPNDIWDRQSIETLIEHLLRLLDAGLREPSLPMSRHQLLSPEQRWTVVARWGAGRRLPYSAETVLGRFERESNENPSAVAVLTEPGSDNGTPAYEWPGITYRELNHRASRFATALKRAGVRRGDVVPICLENSAQLLIAILGVWKVRAAYLPLDVSVAQRRSTDILIASRARLVVTSAEGAFSLPKGPWRAITLNDQIREDRIPSMPCDSDPDDLAYVMYTSGSTGRPKGVEVSHGAVMNVVRGILDALSFRSGDVWLAVTAPTFDISVLELFLPLANGGSVAIPRRESLTTRSGLERVVARSGATVIQATPSQWRVIVATGWTGVPRLRIFCGGEALAADLAFKLGRRCDRLWNMYGPTECTIWATAEELRTRDRGWPGTEKPAIGRPLCNLTVYVLDRHMRPLPAGIVGEIFLGGIGVARGYRHEPALTAASFLPDPFAAEPGRRMYRTGDFGRFDREGVLHFVGRRDDQVKIRGHRIEIPEVEAALRDFPHLAHMAVVLHRPGSGASSSAREFEHNSLVLYGVAHPGASPVIQDVRDFLADKLPNYMAPSRLVRLEALPLTPAGKVDRKLLAELPLPTHADSGSFVPPRTPEEVILTRIWAEVLGRDCVGVSDNFFTLGGDSIQAVIALARAREFGLEISVAQLFRTPTPAELARAASTKPTRNLAETITPILCHLPPSTRDLCQITGERFANLRTRAIFPVPSGVTRDECIAALRALLVTHAALRYEVVRGSDGWVLSQCVSRQPQASVSLTVLRCDSGASSVQASVATSSPPASSAHGEPSSCAFLLQTAETSESWLVLCIHPALVDSASWEIIGSDLELAWRSLKNGTGIALPPASVSYDSCCARLDDAIKHRLANGGPDGGARSFHRSSFPPLQVTELDCGLQSEQWIAATSACRASPLEFFVAAIAVVAVERGQLRFCIDVEEPNRSIELSDSDVSRTVGNLTGRQILELEFSPEQTSMELLRVVKERARGEAHSPASAGSQKRASEDSSNDGLVVRMPSPYEFRPEYWDPDFLRALFLEENMGPAVIAGLWDGKLRVSLIRAGHHRSAFPLDGFPEAIQAACQRIAEDARRDAGASLVPSDFSLASIDRKQLVRIVAALRNH